MSHDCTCQTTMKTTLLWPCLKCYCVCKTNKCGSGAARHGDQKDWKKILKPRNLRRVKNIKHLYLIMALEKLTFYNGFCNHTYFSMLWHYTNWKRPSTRILSNLFSEQIFPCLKQISLFGNIFKRPQEQKHSQCESVPMESQHQRRALNKMSFSCKLTVEVTGRQTQH